jgi:hypothetical protein
MKTVTYNELKLTVADLVGLDRTSIPTKISTLILGFASLELLQLWNSQPWPELVPDIATVTVTNRSFSKSEGGGSEMGDILGVYTANPLTTTKFRTLGFEEADNKVRVDESIATVYVEYMLPATNLMEISAGSLAATTLPLRFKSILAHKCAAYYFTSLGNASMAQAHMALAELALAHEVARLSVPERRRLSARTGYGRPTTV